MSQNRIVWGSDLYKGVKLGKNGLSSANIDDMLPFQMLTLEQKTPEWIQSVADFYETVGWSNVQRKAGKIQRNFWMRQGVLNPSDYIINPTENDFYMAVGAVMPPESHSPLEKFYPIAPVFIDTMRGEFDKRDNTWTIDVVDPDSVSEMFRYKNDQFYEILLQAAQLEQDQALAQMGITPETSPEEYQQQMQALQQQMTEVEFKSKNYRTTGAKWAEKVVKIQERRFNMKELEGDAFECGLISDREFWHLDLMDGDFKLELLNPKWCDYHKGPNVKYVSDGDYFLWFDFMSAGDIVNKFGRKMKEEDMDKLRDVHFKTANLIVPDYLKGRQDSYYDYNKSWSEATDLDPKMNDALLGKELAYSFMQTSNFEHNQDIDIFNPVASKMMTGRPQMFRVMRMYWRSMRKIGWLTKVNRDGTRLPGDWVDENFIVTIDPVYDNSVVKEKTKDNLLYGEHVDWSWGPEWREVVKISPNNKHTFWMNSRDTMHSIYIGGQPTKFQFKGRNNPLDSLPPVEGCEYSWFNAGPHSMVDRIASYQIIHNIAMNKVPRKMLEDHGNKVIYDKRLYQTNNPSLEASELDPQEEFENRLYNSSTLPYNMTRESLEGLGQPALPQVLQLSTAQEAQYWLQIAQLIKLEAGEVIGINRNRLGQNKASETATGIQQGLNYSETTTEKYFEQHSNLMEKVRQRMLDAAQFYSTISEDNRAVYMNEDDENVFIDIEAMENSFRHYNIYLKSKASVRNALNTISQFLYNENTLPIKPSAKVASLVETSIPKILTLIKEGEIELDQKQQQERDHQIRLEEERRNTLLAQQEQMFNQQMAIQESKNESAETVATIRALGGIQTDNNANQVPDAQENLNLYFKQQELADKRNAAQNVANAKRQTELDKMVTEKEKSMLDVQKEKIKGEYALKVAKENKQKYDRK